MHLAKFRSLNHKLVTSICTIALCLAVATTAVSFIVELERAQLKTDVMLNQLLDTVEDSAAIATYSNNKEIATDVLNGLLKNDIVKRVVLSSKGGFNLEKSKTTPVTIDAKAQKSIVRQLRSPFGDSQDVGFILIEPAAEYNLIEAKHGAINNALNSIGLISVTALIILWVVGKNFSKPLTLVSNTLHAITSGEKQRIPLLPKNINDELGSLVADINNLLAVLENKFNDERALRLQVENIEQQLRHIFNSSSAGLFLMDEQGRFITFNSKLKAILNISHIDDESLIEDYVIADFFKERQQFNDFIQRALHSGRLETQDFALSNTNDYAETWLHCLVSKVIDAQGDVRLEAVLFDVTERVKHALAVRHEADHDPLTGLLRRQAAKNAFEYFVTNRKNPDVSFLLMDLDGFKQANDTYGHLVGDSVLSITGERLMRCVRSTDIVCRLGGDEFLVILMPCSSASTEFEAAENIVKSIQKPMSADANTQVNVGISVGIASYQPGQDFDTLLKLADEAMYEVKRQGKNGYCYFDGASMNVKLLRPESAASMNVS